MYLYDCELFPIHGVGGLGPCDGSRFHVYIFIPIPVPYLKKEG